MAKLSKQLPPSELYSKILELLIENNALLRTLMQTDIEYLSDSRKITLGQARDQINETFLSFRENKMLSVFSQSEPDK